MECPSINIIVVVTYKLIILLLLFQIYHISVKTSNEAVSGNS